jgi:hypothetical protein
VQPRAIPHQRERIAADAVHHRLDHREDGGGGHGGVDGVATRLEHGQARLRRCRLRGGHHLTAEHGAASPRIG